MIRARIRIFLGVVVLTLAVLVMVSPQWLDYLTASAARKSQRWMELSVAAALGVLALLTVAVGVSGLRKARRAPLRANAPLKMTPW